MLRKGKKIKETPIGLGEVHQLLENLNGILIRVDHRKYGFSPKKGVISAKEAFDTLSSFSPYAYYKGTHRVYETNGQQKHFVYLEGSLIIDREVHTPVIEKATLEYTVNTT